MADKLANTVSLLLEVLREKAVLIAAIVGESSSDLDKQIWLALKWFGFGLFGQVRIINFKSSISLFEMYN